MRLMDRLPENYLGSQEMTAWQGAWQSELDGLWTVRDDLLLQLDPNTATWGLVFWERALGIILEPSRNLAQRRAQVVARLQIRPPVTPELVRSVCERILGFEVSIIEHIPNYVVEIDLVGVMGLPANIGDLVRELEELLPAHLDWIFTIHYRTHRVLRPYTHGELAAYTHQTIKGGDMTNGVH